MTGGILQLVAIGVDNVYLIGDPQITFFKIVYRRHTNFSTYVSKLSAEGNTDADGEFIIKLANKGDLIKDIHLVVEIPNVNLTFQKPTRDLISSIFTNYKINWPNTFDANDLITLDIYNNGKNDVSNSIVNTINNDITKYLLTYDYYALQNARLSYVKKEYATRLLDLVGSTFLIKNGGDILLDALTTFGTNYFIDFMTNNPTIDYTIKTNYTGMLEYMIEISSDRTIINTVVFFINTFIDFLIPYLTQNPLQKNGDNVIISQLKDYVDVFYVSNELSIANEISYMIENTNNKIITNIVNTALTSRIQTFLDGTFDGLNDVRFIKLIGIIEPFLETLINSFVEQFGTIVFSKTSDIVELVAQFYGTYCEPQINPHTLESSPTVNIYSLLMNYGVVNNYDTSYLQNFVKSLISEQPIQSPYDFFSENNITNKIITVFLQPYISSLASTFKIFVFSRTTFAFNVITTKFLDAYVLNNSIESNDYILNMLYISNSSTPELFSCLLAYFDLIKAAYIEYSSGILFGQTTPDEFVNTQNTLIERYVTDIFVSNYKLMQIVIIADRCKRRDIGLNFLELYNNDNTLQIFTYSQQWANNNNNEYYFNNIQIFLKELVPNYVAYVSTNGLQYCQQSIDDFYIDELDSIKEIEYENTLLEFVTSKRMDIVLSQNTSVNNVNQERNLINYFKLEIKNYIELVATNSNYTSRQYVNDYIIGTNGDVILGDFLEILLDASLKLFYNASGYTTFTLQEVDEWFTLNVDIIDNEMKKRYDSQHEKIINLNLAFLESVSERYMTTLVEQSAIIVSNVKSGRESSLSIFSPLLSTDAFNENFLDSVDYVLPPFINTTLFDNGKFYTGNNLTGVVATSIETNTTYKLIFDGLYALYNDISNTSNFSSDTLVLHDGDYARILMYNYYLDHIVKIYYDSSTIKSFDDTLNFSNYNYPNPNFLNTTTGIGHTVFDPIYSKVKDSIVFLHIIDMAEYTIQQNQIGSSTELFFENILASAYNNYVNFDILKVATYTSSDAYNIYKNYNANINVLLNTITTTNNLVAVSQQITNNIFWNILLNFDQLKSIFEFLNHATFDESSHYRIGLFKKYTLTTDIFSGVGTIFTSIAESVYTELADNMIQPMILSNVGNVPSGVTNFFKKNVISAVRKFVPQCQNIMHQDAHVSYLNDFSLWKNLLIDISKGTLLATRLSQQNDTIKNLTNDYMIFSADYKNVALLNYLPYLVVHDIPFLFNEILKTSVFTFIKNTDANYVSFLNTFNLLDGDENNTGLFYGSSADKAIKLHLYKTVAESVIFNNSGGSINIVDDTYIKKMSQIYASNASDYLMTAIFRPEGLFPEFSTVDQQTDMVSDEGSNSFLPIEWICNTYKILFQDKIDSYFTTFNFPSATTSDLTTYKTTMVTIVTEVIGSFMRQTIPSYNRYISNGYTFYNIDSGSSGLSFASATTCDALSSVWFQIQMSLIQSYNSVINTSLLSYDYYHENIGGIASQVFTQVQTQFVNMCKPFNLQSGPVNFDMFGIYFLTQIEESILTTQVGDLIVQVFGLNSNCLTQYEILIYQYLNGLTTLYKTTMGKILKMMPHGSTKLSMIINQFFVQSRDEITKLEIQITNQNIRIHNFGKSFLYGFYELNNKKSIVLNNNTNRYEKNDWLFNEYFNYFTNASIDSVTKPIGFYLKIYLDSLTNLFCFTMSSTILENIRKVDQVIDRFYKDHFSTIVGLESVADDVNNNIDLYTPFCDNISGFGNSSILLLNSGYVYYTRLNPHPDVFKTYHSSYVPVSTITGYDFYRIRMSSGLTSTYKLLEEYIDDYSKYYNSVYSNYSTYKNILNMRKDYNNIKWNISNSLVYLIKTKKDYYYDTSTNTISTFTYHTSSTYVTPLFKNSSGSQIKTNMLKILTDTQTVLTNKYAGIVDITTHQQSGTEIIPNSNIYSIYDLFLLIENATNNPFNQIYYANMYAWYDTNSENPLMPNVFSYIRSILQTITPNTLFNDKNIIKLYNNFSTYQDMIFYVCDQVIKKTPLSFLLNEVDVTIYDTMTNMNNVITSMINTNISNLTKITNYTTTNLTPQIGFNYVFLGDTDIELFKLSSNGFATTTTQLEKTLLKIITHTTPSFAWVKELGHAICESITLKIGGQEIETYNPSLLHLLHKLYDSSEHSRGYDNMIGNVKEMYTISSEQRSIRKLFIPLRFWFCRHTGCSLPLISMMYTDAIIKIKMNKLSNILFTEETSQFVRKPKLKCYALGTYIYLEESERLKFSEAKLEYLFDKFTYVGQTILNKKKIFDDISFRLMSDGLTMSYEKTKIDDFYKGSKVRIPLKNLTESTKYLLWTIKFIIPSDVKPEDIIDWQTCGYNLRNVNGIREVLSTLCDGIKIKFNGRDREDYKEEIYYTHVTPWSRYMGDLDNGQYMYSFALLPLLLQPSGTVNMSQIEECTLVLNFNNKLLEKFFERNMLAVVEVWACTYNIFRVVSGMAAPLFYQSK
jgi:hypothetical protein